jgi:cytochrome P450
MESIFNNPQYFTNPGEFKPERFIDIDSGRIKNSEIIGAAFGFGNKITECNL